VGIPDWAMWSSLRTNNVHCEIAKTPNGAARNVEIFCDTLHFVDHVLPESLSAPRVVVAHGCCGAASYYLLLSVENPNRSEVT